VLTWSIALPILLAILILISFVWYFISYGFQGEDLIALIVVLLLALWVGAGAGASIADRLLLVDHATAEERHPVVIALLNLMDVEYMFRSILFSLLGPINTKITIETWKEMGMEAEKNQKKQKIRQEQEEQRKQDIRSGKANVELRLELCNDTAHDLIEINVYDGSVNVGNWQGQRLSSLDGGRYEPVVFSLKREYPGFFNIKIEYKCAFNDSILTAVHEQRISVTDRDISKKIYLDHKWF
jgi:hypothetical protein